MPFPICGWVSTFHRIEYGFLGFGLHTGMLCPRSVPVPRDAPVGCTIPVGNGSLRVTAGRKLPVVPEPRMLVLELKPGWFTACGVPSDATNTPKPARMTVPRPGPPGVHARPNRGLK